MAEFPPPQREAQARRLATDCPRLREWFEEALALPQSAREDWLRAQSMSEPQRERVRRLLRADEAGHGYLETPPFERVARIGEQPDGDIGASLVGQRIGAFRLLRVLGRGGMAIVYLAEREGCDFRQHVAVKLLRRGLYSELEQRLFQVERRALAALSHPNIARLIDGGVTETGMPYLVMDYVDGEPITHHAATRRLGVPERLRLFARICAAVAAAHQRLIVHRDIKPSNILVDADGEVKLLDFGIAKLLDEDTGSAAATGLPVLTPGHAAPEQYVGGPITTATDVYALGLLLHELLLGARAADPPRRPSTQVSQEGVDATRLPMSRTALRGALAGDLDNILLKALAGEPERRYASARELGDDVERHLRGEPVAAHPPSQWYRARKFALRHRGGVLMTALLLAAILAALGVAVWQADVARSQAQRASEVQAFVEELFQPLEEGSALARAPSLQQLMQRGRERIDQRYPDNPQVRADLLAMFARIGDGVGETADNRALAEAAWRANAFAYGEQDVRSLDARSLFARVLRKLGDYPAALVEYEAVRSIMLKRGRGGQAYARLLDAMSWVLMEQGIDPQRAIALKREALDLREADPGASADDLGTGYNNLGAAYQYAGDPAQALGWYRKALALDRANHGDSLATATSLMNVGMVQTQMGRWRAGEASLGEARAMFARIPLDRHPSLVSLLVRLCGVQGDLESSEASATCTIAVDMAREVHGRMHSKYAMALTRAARARLATGDDAAAARAFAEAREVLAGSSAEVQRETGIIDAAQARSWWLRGDYASLRDAMLRWLEKHPTPGGRTAALAMAALACRHAPAAGCDPTLADQAELGLAAARGPDTPDLLPARLGLAEIAWLDARPAAAIEPTETLLLGIETELGAHHSLVVQAHMLLAALHAQAGDGAAAARHADQAAAGLAWLPPGHSLRQHESLYRHSP
jgi:serine/threonine-protein kinase